MGAGGQRSVREDVADMSRVMVVDDSAVARGVIKRILDEVPGIEVVATAVNGEQALKVAQQTRPDLVILDIEMPVMDGMATLPRLLTLDPDLKIIIASGLAERAAKLSLDALSKGAADFVVKPSSGLGGADVFRDELVTKVRVHGGNRRQARKAPAPPAPAFKETKQEASSASQAKTRAEKRQIVRPDIIAIGSSTGGPQALAEVIRYIGPRIAQPILITQHMPSNFTAMLAEQLGRIGGRVAAEAVDGETVEEKKIYVAPGGQHLLVEGRAAGGALLRLSDGPPENSCRPAVDPMLRSLSRVFGDRVLVVILTGMGVDGMKGCESIVDGGGVVLAQDMATSVVWGMPGAVANAGLAHSVLPIGEIGPAIERIAKGE